MRPSHAHRLSTTIAVLLAASVGSSAEAIAAETDVVQSIERYCTTCWKNAGIARQDWDDCTQEAIVELLSRIDRGQLDAAIGHGDSEERRELNRSVWCAAQRWRRTKRPQPLGDRDVNDREPGSEFDDDVQHLRDVLPQTGLSDRQQRIIAHTLDGDSVAEIAEALDTTPARVSDEKYKAIRKLRQQLVA